MWQLVKYHGSFELPFETSRIIRIANAVRLSAGWRRRLFAFATGAIGALALAPCNFMPAFFIPMTMAVWLIDGCAEPYWWPSAGNRILWLPEGAWRALSAGWWWGFGYFLAGLWWLGAAFLVEADEYAWAMPLGVAGLPAVLAFFPAIGFLTAWLLWSPNAGRLFALAAGLGFAEWLRGHVLTGFPWNSFGMALAANLATAQAASLIGLYGLTLLSILLFSVPALFGDKRMGDRPTSLWLPPAVLAAGLTFCSLYFYGAWRLAAAQSATVPGVRLRLMQPNLPQDAKFRPENKASILAHYLSLSAASKEAGRRGLENITALIWPESAFPFILSHDRRALAEIGALLPSETVLVTGAARQGMSVPPASGPPHYFNAIQVVASGGVILDGYDKVHLVPFGEYLPFQSIFDALGLHQFVHVPGGFEPGSHHRLLMVPGLPPVSPLICYEAIFPDEALVPVAERERPGLILNVTNDGWFGTTSGPYQHFAQAKLRAIEEGLPLIRVANTGISAIISPYGQVLGEIPLGMEGVLDGDLPRRISAPFFSYFPYAGVCFLWILSFFAAIINKTVS